jgi:uncharacterized membrane protein
MLELVEDFRYRLPLVESVAKAGCKSTTKLAVVAMVLASHLNQQRWEVEEVEDFLMEVIAHWVLKVVENVHFRLPLVGSVAVVEVRKAEVVMVLLEVLAHWVLKAVEDFHFRLPLVDSVAVAEVWKAEVVMGLA